MFMICLISFKYVIIDQRVSIYGIMACCVRECDLSILSYPVLRLINSIMQSFIQPNRKFRICLPLDAIPVVYGMENYDTQ